MQGLTFFRPELKNALEGFTGMAEGESIDMLAGQTKPLTDVAFRAFTFDLTLQGQSFLVSRINLPAQVSNGSVQMSLSFELSQYVGGKLRIAPFKRIGGALEPGPDARG